MPYRSTGGVRNGNCCQSQPPSANSSSAAVARARWGTASSSGRREASRRQRAEGQRAATMVRAIEQRAADGRRRRDERGGQRLAQLRVGEQRPPVGRGARSAHQFPGGGEQRQMIAAIVPRPAGSVGTVAAPAVPAPARQPMPRAARQAPAVRFCGRAAASA